MTAPASLRSYSECPLKPPPEESRILTPSDPIASARVPSNACTETKCAWFVSSIDQRTGKIVGGPAPFPSSPPRFRRSA